jgi:hypothetical protein
MKNIFDDFELDVQIIEMGEISIQRSTEESTGCSSSGTNAFCTAPPTYSLVPNRC